MGRRSFELAKKLADVFDTTLDYLVNASGKMKDFKDKAMLERVMEIKNLDQDDRKTVLHVIDSLLRDAKARKTYAMHG